MTVFERNVHNAREYDWRWRIANPTELSAQVGALFLGIALRARKIVPTEPREQREQCELAHALPSRVRGRHMSTQSSLLELLRRSLSYVNYAKIKFKIIQKLFFMAGRVLAIG